MEQTPTGEYCRSLLSQYSEWHEKVPHFGGPASSSLNSVTAPYLLTGEILPYNPTAGQSRDRVCLAWTMLGSDITSHVYQRAYLSMDVLQADCARQAQHHDMSELLLRDSSASSTDLSTSLGLVPMVSVAADAFQGLALSVGRAHGEMTRSHGPCYYS